MSQQLQEGNGWRRTVAERLVKFNISKTGFGRRCVWTRDRQQQDRQVRNWLNHVKRITIEMLAGGMRCIRLGGWMIEAGGMNCPGGDTREKREHSEQHQHVPP